MHSFVVIPCANYNLAMKPVTTFVVSPTLPTALQPLKELAYNYWWCWHAGATELFHRIDPQLWEETHHNPVALLSGIPLERLEALAGRPEYVSQLQEVHAEFRDYMDGRGWFSTLEAPQASWIAYFCAEFGIHESFSNYSGGLGVLAGDHLKSASDLGLPLVGIGLLYQEGYFRQYLTQNGWQNERYTSVDPYMLPIIRVTGPDGTPLSIHVDLPLGRCYAHIWRLNVGRAPLYLLDTNIPENTVPELANITDRLYGGTIDTRVMQEMMLGIGGIRALDALGIEPSVCHINEGHAAFSMLERSRLLMEKSALSFAEAWNLVRSASVFTTHTPVPAGNEIFHHDTMATYFTSLAAKLGLSWQEFLTLGAQTDPSLEDGFSMTVLGLKGALVRNGVSKLHGDVARTMWHAVWPGIDVSDVPIGAVTNGVHTATWVATDIADVYDRYLGREWRTTPEDPSAWEAIDAIPDFELWRAHTRRRERLVVGARDHVLNKHSASLTQEQLAGIHDLLDPDVLTIGFARRFASYKRADLLFRDLDRLTSLVHHPDRPIQFVLAGKAHPRDIEGKELIQRVLNHVKANGLEQRIVFLEDYDMAVARMMVRGCDVWLNTPRRPYEASGTSGMKAVLNGALHFSVLDGWWAEAYTPEVGFAIGRGEELDSMQQDAADSETLYDTLEHVVAPMFYDRTRGRIPQRWVAMMKRSIKALAPAFAARRMVCDYATQAYVPSMERWLRLTANNFAGARQLTSWLAGTTSAFANVAVRDVNVSGGLHAHVGKRIHVDAVVELAGLSPADVVVQALHGSVDGRGHISPAKATEMQLQRMDGVTAHYAGDYVCTTGGLQGCTVRVMARHGAVPADIDNRMIVWAS